MKDQFITHSDMPQWASFTLAACMVGFYCAIVGGVSIELASAANDYLINPVTEGFSAMQERFGLE